MRGAAGRTAGADQGFIHDLADGVGAAAALGAAAEAAIDLAGGARRSRCTAPRTSWSLSTLQEQTIIENPARCEWLAEWHVR